MAIIIKTGKHIKLTKNQCRLIAVNEIIPRATLNKKDINEDFYESFFAFLLENIGIETDCADGFVVLDDVEREIMRKEFEAISTILSRRRDKIISKIKPTS